MTKVVYFIGIRRDVTAPIKIGITGNLNERLKLIQNGNHQDLVVIGFVEGSHADEALIHRAFCRQHIRNEWFHRTDEMNAFIVRLLSDGFAHERQYLLEKARSGWGINVKSIAGIEKIRAAIAAGAEYRRTKKSESAA